MFILNEKRINIHAPFTTSEGVTYGNLTDPEVRNQLGVLEISDPTPPEDYSESTYYRTEQDEAPYVIYTKKSTEQILAQLLQSYEQALDSYLDSVAQADRWTDRFTFAVRAGYPNMWQAKAAIFGNWMDSCNSFAYQLMQDVAAGTVTIPSKEEFLAMLPPLPPELVDKSEPLQEPASVPDPIP